MRTRASSANLKIGLLTLLSTTAVGLVVIVKGLEKAEFVLLVVLFAVASVAFVIHQGPFSGRRIFEIPCFLTVACFLEFGLTPLVRQMGINPYFESPSLDGKTLAKGLLYVITGMIGFWAGCYCLRHQKRQRHGSLTKGLSELDFPWHGRTLIFALIIYAVASSARLYMLKLQIYSYVGSIDVYYSNLAFAQMMGFLAQLGGYALIIITIERFSGPQNPKINICFWSIFVSECAWGLISGMKGLLLQNFLLVAVVVSFLRARIAKRWLIGFTAGLVLVYPLFDQYRFLTRGPSPIEIVNPSQAFRAHQLALLEAAEETKGSSGWIQAGVQSTLQRLDLLDSVGEIVSLGSDASKLQGDEKLWMIPLYPLVPRLIWKSKPILDKGARFSEILGYGQYTSTAVTYPGDLYFSMGVAGVIAGMFVLGIVARRLTDAVTYDFGKKKLFFYAAIFLPCTNIEVDAFSLWSGFIRSFVTITLIAWIAYPATGRILGQAKHRKSRFRRLSRMHAPSFCHQ